MPGMSGYGECELSDAPQALPRQQGPKVALQEHIIIIINTILNEQDGQSNAVAQILYTYLFIYLF